jgi:indoleamine 2,3-dioxygenase
MPGLHRDYLVYLENSPRPLRELVKETPVLRDPYNSAVKALRKFRDAHIRIVCLYVVNASKIECPAMKAIARQQQTDDGRRPARGTGGTELATLLKAGRDATKRAVLD